jgi:hypothetical protein
MAKVSRVASLDIPSDRQFETKEWRTERIGWLLMAALIVLAALGLLGGGGPLNTVQLGSPTDRVWVEYRRVIRNQAPAELRIHAAPDESFIGITTLHINRSYADAFVVESVSPTLIQEEIGTTAISYDFATPGAGPATMVFRFRPERFGVRFATISVEGAGSQTFWQLILP